MLARGRRYNNTRHINQPDNDQQQTTTSHRVSCPPKTSTKVGRREIKQEKKDKKTLTRRDTRKDNNSKGDNDIKEDGNKDNQEDNDRE